MNSFFPFFTRGSIHKTSMDLSQLIQLESVVDANAILKIGLTQQTMQLEPLFEHSNSDEENQMHLHLVIFSGEPIGKTLIHKRRCYSHT